MGMPVRIVLYAAGEDSARVAAADAFARIAALEPIFSDYRPDSEIRRLAERDGVWTPVSAELFSVMRTALRIADVTSGAFDPTVGPLVALWRESRTTRRLPLPAALAAARARVGWRGIELDAASGAIRLARPGMRLDLGGIAKGFILQEALRTLAARGMTRALVEAGGDIVVGAAPPGREGWQLAVPHADATFAARVHGLTDAALATSGPTAQFVDIDGVRYSHIVDPRTGVGATQSVVAHVIARDAAVADALATALSILGRDALCLALREQSVIAVSLQGDASSATPDCGRAGPHRSAQRR
jgi:thiamine biosynthesis lipoprotein